MSRRNKHIPNFDTILRTYAENHLLDLYQYSPYHYRLTDSGYTTVDMWTTGRYYVMTTDYLELVGEGMVERGGEKGSLPTNLDDFLDKLFMLKDEQ